MAKKKAKVKPKRRSKKPGSGFSGKSCCGASFSPRGPKKKMKAASFTTRGCKGKKKK